MRRAAIPLLRLCFALGVALSFASCSRSTQSGPEADATKTREEVAADAQKADVGQLEEIVAGYRAALEAQQAEVAQAVEDIKSLAPGELLGGAGAELQDRKQALEKELRRLEENLQVYADALDEKRAGS